MPVTTRSQLKQLIKTSKSKSKSKSKSRSKSRAKTTSKNTQMLFKGLYLKKYKRGIKIVTETSHSLWGTPYVSVGKSQMYWNNSFNCWFCSTTCEEELLNNGAKWFSKKNTSKKTKLKKSMLKQLFDGMYVKSYGKGFLLVPKKGHNDWGEKYYHNGWWMPTKNSWFFKKEYHNFLMVNGAETSSENDVTVLSDYSDDYQELDKNLFKNTVLKNYKKGLILKPKKNHPDWGEKYYHNGFWNETLQSWVFKPDAKDFLVNHGAKAH